MVDIGLYAVYVLLGVALILSIAFPALYSIKHPKESKYIFIGVVTLVVIIGVTWALSTSELYFAGHEKFNLTPGVIKFVGAGLNTVIVLGIFASLAAIVSEVSSSLK